MAKERSFKLFLVAILVLVICFLTSFMIWALNSSKFNFFGINGSKAELLKTSEHIYTTVNKINVESKQSDIRVYASNDDKIKVNIYGEPNSKVDIELNDNVLTVSDLNKSICFGFCFSNSLIEIYVPLDYTDDIYLKSISGDIKMENTNSRYVDINTTSGEISAKTLDNTKIKSVSGDVKILAANTADISTVSGDIELNEVTMALNIETTSGDVEVLKANILRNSNIKTVSGEVEIERLNNIYVETSTRSGDVNVFNNNRLSNTVLTIKTTSGDIDVN